MALAGRIVPDVKCPACGHRSANLFFAASEGWARACPGGCGGTVRPEHGYAGGGGRVQRFYGNRRFAGSERESISEGFSPEEYEQACRIYGDIDGVQLVKGEDAVTVYFDDRRAQREFTKRRVALEDAYPEVDPGPIIHTRDHYLDD